MTNELLVGIPRLCHLIDGNPDTPDTVVMLQDTGDAITTTFPIAGMTSYHRGPYDRWWSPNVTFGDDPDRTKYNYAPPPNMVVYDDAGPVALVGCHATGGSTRSFFAGKGVIVADFAVLGGSLPYNKINGMRTTSPAYSQWARGSSIDISREPDDRGRLRSLTMTLKPSETTSLSRRLNLSMCRYWSSTPTPEGYDIREPLTIQTLVTKPRTWAEHLDLHIGILDLVSIAAWRNCAFQEIHVNRRDDPLRALAGNIVDPEQWLEVVSHKLPGDDLTDCRGRFLFCYEDMPQGAIDAWLRLRKGYGRALDYLMRILRSGHTWSPQSAIMSGIALEQLGYLIEVDRHQGAQLNGRGSLSFKKALDTVLDDMKTLPSGLDDVDDWIERCRNVYMGAKHGDREEADHLTMLNTLRENLLVLRYWVAQRLGVSGKVLQQNLKWDPLRSGFTLLES